jgi:hypothetical protein
MWEPGGKWHKTQHFIIWGLGDLMLWSQLCDKNPLNTILKVIKADWPSGIEL